jgi:hypothetical protein
MRGADPESISTGILDRGAPGDGHLLGRMRSRPRTVVDFGTAKSRIRFGALATPLALLDLVEALPAFPGVRIRQTSSCGGDRVRREGEPECSTTAQQLGGFRLSLQN